MTNKFEHKTAKVAVVDASASGRQTLTDFFKKFGFTNVHGLPNLKNVIEELEVEPDAVDWIISPLNSDNLENGLSLLKICTLIPALKNVRISLFLEESERVFLPAAFELGLFSWHRKPFTKDSLQEDFEELMRISKDCHWNDTLTSAEYLRKVLREHKSFKCWMALEKNLVNLFPGSPRLLLNIAEIMFHTEKHNKALATLKQVTLIDPNLEKEATNLKNQFVTKDESEKLASTEEGVNVLGISSVVVVDPDDTIQKLLKDVLTEAGVDQIHFFNDGIEAAKYIKENPNPGLVIQEWRVPKMSGPSFLQRILAEGATTTPVIVVSSLLKQFDLPIVREMGVANIITKPLEKHTFLQNLVLTIQEERSPNDVAAMERKIRSLLRAKKQDQAALLVSKFLALPTADSNRKKLIEAEFAYTKGEYTKARDLCFDAIKHQGDSVNALNLLGKSLMQLRDFEPALKCLRKAQEFSPMNIERICGIAEAEAEIGRQEAAADSIIAAKEIDNNSAKVKQTEVNVALTTGDTDKAKQLMANMDSFEDIVSYMNNKAVALSRNGFFEEGMDEYGKTVNALPEDQSDLRSRIHYNMALGYARASELDMALKEVETALVNPNRKIRTKAESLKFRLEQSLKSGTTFELASSKDPQPSLEFESKKNPGADDELKLSQNELLVSSLLAERGDMACYLLFTSTEPHSAEVKEMLEKLPRFQVRKAIEKKESIPK